MFKNFFTKRQEITGSNDLFYTKSCLECNGKKLTCSDYIKIQKYNFISKIVYDIKQRLTGIDADLSRLLVNYSQNEIGVKGLFEFIIDAFVNIDSNFVELIDVKNINSNYYYDVYLNSHFCNKDFLYFENKKILINCHHFNKKNDDKDIICIDFKCDPLSKLLSILYSVQYSIINGMYTGASISNAVLVQKFGLNQMNPNLEEHLMTSMETVKEAFQSFGEQIAILDAEDKVQLLQPIKDTYTEYQKVIDSMIANVTSFPISYINGILSGSLNTTGEGDKVQLDNALRTFYEKYIVNYIELLCAFLNYDFSKISFLNDIVGRFTDFAQYLPNLEATRLLSEEKKQEILYHALGYTNEQLEKDRSEGDLDDDFELEDNE